MFGIVSEVDKVKRAEERSNKRRRNSSSRRDDVSETD